MKTYIDDSRVHDGHRGRMRSKLLAHGQRIFDTYELLEMLLYWVIPCRDTNPVAKNLLYAFGSLDGVYENIGDSSIAPKLREKLENDRENAYLSYDLATIRPEAHPAPAAFRRVLPSRVLPAPRHADRNGRSA